MISPQGGLTDRGMLLGIPVLALFIGLMLVALDRHWSVVSLVAPVVVLALTLFVSWRSRVVRRREGRA